MNFNNFLQENEYIDFKSPLIQGKSKELFSGNESEIEKARIAFLYVRDEIPHSFDCNAKIITAKASDVLKNQTGICHAKANLFAALMRSQKIPSGFCYQHITLAEDDSLGYCIHCYNTVFLDDHWVKVDVRGNTNGKNAQFSLDKPILAFENRKEYDEYDWCGIYCNPHRETMKMLEEADSIAYIMEHIPDMITEAPDFIE